MELNNEKKRLDIANTSGKQQVGSAHNQHKGNNE
jgi:hypothetical protein